MSDTRSTRGALQAIDRLQLAIMLTLPKHDNEELTYLNNLSFTLDHLTIEDPIQQLPVDELLDKITTRIIDACADTQRMLLTQDLWLSLREELSQLANSFEKSSAIDLAIAGHDKVIAGHRAARTANNPRPAAQSPTYWQVPSLWSPARSVSELKTDESIHSRFGSPSILSTESETESGDERLSPVNSGYLSSEDEDNTPSPAQIGVNPFSFR